ncbi:MAG: hypothetical protein ACOYEV_18845 [Candidatus Nanopelagicales bacterium]
MRNLAFKGTTLVGDALSSVAALVPASWVMNQRVDSTSDDGRLLDAVVDLTAPSGCRVSFAVEAKRSGAVPTAHLLSLLRDLRRNSPLPVLFLSDYVGPSVRAALAKEGINFADATGWVRVSSDDPLVLITGQGAQQSPRSERTSAVVRLNGIATSRAIRELTTTSLTIGVRDLADLAGVSPGSVSKSLVTLAAEGIVDRDDRGAVVLVRPRALVQRWARDYPFIKANKPVGYYIAPRGLDRTLLRLDDLDVAVALTGSAAARRLLLAGTTSVVPLRLLALYAVAPSDLARELGLIEADPPTANVVIAAPQDPQILKPDDGDLLLAPPPLVLADPLTLPNRSNAEADQLMDALACDEPAWKE